MFAMERKQHIIEFVKKHNLASVAQLAKEFDVHEATIRRDLAFIESEGILRRTHGGVVLTEEIHSEPEFSKRATERIEEKESIGKMAASLVEEGDLLILDSGTTTLQMVKHLLAFEELTIITNDINIAAELRMQSTFKVFVTGGLLTPESYMLNGMHTNQMLKSLNVNKVFLGTPAIHVERGLTHFDEHLAPAKKYMIEVAKEIIVLTDHTKIGKLSLHNVAPIQKVHCLVTDYQATDEQCQAFEEANVRVMRGAAEK